MRPILFALILFLGPTAWCATTWYVPDNYTTIQGAISSPLVVAGDTVYLSGTIGVDPATGVAHTDIDAEIRQVLDNVKERLAHVGLTMDDLVSVQVFCPDLTLYDRFNGIYATYFEENQPARAFIGSGPLLRDGHFEIQGVAVIR